MNLYYSSRRYWYKWITNILYCDSYEINNLDNKNISNLKHIVRERTLNNNLPRPFPTNRTYEHYIDQANQEKFKLLSKLKPAAPGTCKNLTQNSH